MPKTGTSQRQGQNIEGVVDDRRLRNVLSAVHQGILGRPVAIAIGGLGHTKAVLARAGISRIGRDYVHTLANLPEADTREVFAEWLAHTPRIRDWPEARREPWLDCLVDRSRCWPAHITTCATATFRAFGDEALDTEEALRDRMEEEIREDRNACCNSRAAGLSGAELVAPGARPSAHWRIRTRLGVWPGP